MIPLQAPIPHGAASASSTLVSSLFYCKAFAANAKSWQQLMYVLCSHIMPWYDPLCLMGIEKQLPICLQKSNQISLGILLTEFLICSVTAIDRRTAELINGIDLLLPSGTACLASFCSLYHHSNNEDLHYQNTFICDHWTCAGSLCKQK